MRFRVAQIRKERGLTQDQLAKAVGMSKGYLSEIENGKKTVNGRRLEAFARALGVAPADLIDDPGVSEEVADHLRVLRSLSHEDQEAVMRHARGLLRAKP